MKVRRVVAPDIEGINRIIDHGTLDELIAYAKELNLHFPIKDNTSFLYKDRVTRIKARLLNEGIDPNTIRNEYWDNKLLEIGETNENSK